MWMAWVKASTISFMGVLWGSAMFEGECLQKMFRDDFLQKILRR
jgi:hypothetical protein